MSYQPQLPQAPLLSLFSFFRHGTAKPSSSSIQYFLQKGCLVELISFSFVMLFEEYAALNFNAISSITRKELSSLGIATLRELTMNLPRR